MQRSVKKAEKTGSAGLPSITKFGTQQVSAINLFITPTR